MIICATGHRPNRLGGYDNLPIIDEFAMRILSTRKRPSGLISGMAQGWDQSIAVACVRLGIPFVAAVPFEGQEKRWPDATRRTYNQLLSAASQVHVVAKDYSDSAYLLRDRWMVDNSQAVLALWNGDRASGTGATVAYAREGNRPIENVWPEWQAWYEFGGYLV